jgi:glycosyltransferase involved in cell wall biosynthesis
MQGAGNLRILVAHTYYRSSAPSGEDAAFDSERRLLERSGIEVIPFTRRNDDIDDTSMLTRMKLAMDTSWSTGTYRSLHQLIREKRPDVAHFHNTFPQMSPSAYAACRELGVPVVQTLHNYRLVCAGALLQRDGQPCEKCLNGSAVLGLLPGLVHRCYRGSLGATGALTLMLATNRLRGSYARNVDRYIALTRFAASRLAAGGLPADRIVVKPNCLDEEPEAGRGGGGFALYVGRLSDEKGVRTLLRAWRHLGSHRLLIVGDGPLREELVRMASAARLAVSFLGRLPRTEVLALARQAAFQVVPSECYEGFPMVVLEAFACGTPVVASRIGSLDELVDEGVTGTKFRATDPEDLVRAVGRLIGDPERFARMRQSCRAVFEQHYTADRNIAQLVAIYTDVMSEATLGR